MKFERKHIVGGLLLALGAVVAFGLFDLNGAAAFLAVAPFLNAAQSAFLDRQLEYIKSQTRDVLYAPYRAFDVIPTSSEVPVGAKSVSWHQYDRIGQAQIIANNTTTIPRVDVIGKEEVRKVRTIADKFGYSVEDIDAAMMAGVNLTTRKRDAAEDLILRKISQIAFSGDTDHDIPGILSHPNVETLTAAVKSGSDTEWDTANTTAQQLYDDLTKTYGQIVDVSKGQHQPNTLLAPPDRLRILRQTRMSTGTDTTVLEFFLRNFPAIRIVEDTPELTGVGTANADVMLMYQADPMVLQNEVPLMFQMLPPQPRDMEIEVICRARTAGTIIYYPLALCAMEGI